MPQHFIDAVDDPLLFERIESFGGGMDAFTRSTLLPPDASQELVNVIIPDNLEIRTRPGADLLGAARSNPIQGLAYFSTASKSHLLAVNAGVVESWDDTVGASWTDTGLTAGALNDSVTQIAMAQGVDTMLVSDGVNQMQIWNGTTWTAGGATDADPPVGAKILCWHTGRMFAAGFPGTVAGKEQDAIWVSARLAFGSGNWDKTLRQFRVGGGEGDPIMAMASLQEFTMGVLKANSVWLIRTDPTADAGNFSASQASESLSYGVGCVGRRAWCNYGNDLLFVARDGVRSLQRMQAAAGQYQLSAPISRPMQPWIDRINWEYADTICAMKYKELALFAVPLDSATSPNYVLVWNGRLERWIGLWTGWLPTAFAMSRFASVPAMMIGQSDGKIRKWKGDNDKAADATYQEDGADVLGQVATRSALFGEPVNDKDGYHAEVRFSLSNGQADITAVADNAEVRTWSVDVRQPSPVLPIVLPFDLVNPVNTPKRKSLRGLTPFNELYLRIEGTSGWFSLRNISLSAFLNMLQNQ